MAQQHSPPSNWDRWPGHYQQNAQYSAIDTSGIISYDPRVSSAAPLPSHHHHEAQYAMGTTYTMASVPSMAPPHSNFGVHPYTPTSPTSMVLPYRQFGDDRSALSETSHGLPYQHRESQPIYRRDYVTSPQIKRDPVPSQLPLPAAPEQGNSSEAPVPEVTPKPYVGNTHIDEMMRAIQAQESDEDDDVEEEEEEEEDGEEEDEDEEDQDTPKGSLQSPPCSSAGSRCSSPRSTKSKRRNKLSKEKRRCTWEGCKRTFTQGTHMRIHMRSHTGEKPYACTFQNCHWTFSQHGNLKTHFRRHTGEKPYKCDQCPREFAQKGNLRAHQSVHDPTKRFHCLIDNCDKPFTQRGNLKNHQNKFHKESVMKYIELFSNKTLNELQDPEDRKLFVHFKDVYKNMNRGIKGRGRGRTIQKKSNNNQMQALHDVPMYPSQQRTPPMEHSIPHQFSHLPSYPQHGLPQAQSWQGYPVAPRDGSYHVVPATRTHYDMYELEHENMSSSASSAGTISTPATSVYDEEHGRSLAFRDRLY
ncbi:putative C2H2-type domain-containing protein [Seiridium unicorne]|uniref:C2H2-type domain-containing protein n=1 Tax=Seiridium unicorne TaxID=138068 RepID=A0ABR2V0Z8_9PEZI